MPHAKNNRCKYQLSIEWFGKSYMNLNEEELRHYQYNYKMLRRHQGTGIERAADYVFVPKSKHITTTGCRQRIVCSCGRSVLTTYAGHELKQHKGLAIHTNWLGNKYDESITSTIDRQWEFSDEELLEYIVVKKKPRALQDVINELD
jgi:hypothetical protein